MRSIWLLLLLLPLTACSDKESKERAASGAAAGHGGAVIDLGTATAGAYALRATRDEGAIVAGKDAAFDVTVTAAADSTEKASVVHFWIGQEDASGSRKSRAKIENPAEPERWHNHVDVPNPLPDGSRLWVEIQTVTGAKTVASFDLKP